MRLLEDLVFRKLNGRKCSNKAISSAVAATFTSHATSKRGQHVFGIFALDVDDSCKHVENGASVEDGEGTDEGLTESTHPDTNDFDQLETTQMLRPIRNDASHVSFWIFVGQ